MRHDVAEDRFLDLGSKYPPAVSVRPADASRGLGGEGTLIAPRWVLTAAHVAVGVGPDDLVVLGDRRVLIERVITHPDWHRMADVKQDVALIRLRSAIQDVRPALLFSGSEVVGSVVIFVGRGAYGTGVTGVRGEDRRLRAATNRISKVDGPFLQFRFDSPDDAAATPLEGISGPGDSGGAAYQRHDGNLYVIGVSSWQDTRPTGRVEGLYGVIEHYVRVSYYYAWIMETIR